MEADISFVLPNGVTIRAELNQDTSASEPNEGWIAVDVVAVHPDGVVEVLCTTEYNREDDIVRVLAHEQACDDYVFEAEYHFNGKDSEDKEPIRRGHSSASKMTNASPSPCLPQRRSILRRISLPLPRERRKNTGRKILMKLAECMTAFPRDFRANGYSLLTLLRYIPDETYEDQENGGGEK